MSRQLPQPGDYTAKATGQLKIIIAETGTVGVAIPYRLTDSEIPFSDTHTVWIAKADGSLLPTGIDALKKVFGWDGTDPWWLMWEDPAAETGPRTFPDLEFRLADCKHEEGNKASADGSMPVYFKPSWLNAMDGGRQLKPADRSSFMKSFGSKFRANSGGKPAAKTAPKTSGPPGRKTAPASELCTMEEAWGAAKAKHSDKSEEDLANVVWYPAIDKLFPDVPQDKQDKLTKQQYGELKAHFA